jgi:glycosyltransferase involved in cell wall biosynthesis
MWELLMNNDDNSVDVIICTYDRYKYLDSAIESVLRGSELVLSKLIVADNTPSCEARDAFSAKYASVDAVEYMLLDTPGLSNARNVAAAKSTSDIIAFLDDDAVASEGWSAAIRSAFQGAPNVAVAGGPVRPIFESERPAWLSDDSLKYLSVVDWGSRKKTLTDLEYLVGANIAFRRETYLECGGCSISLGRKGTGASLLSNEETELTAKIVANGYEVFYNPEASVKHLIPSARLTREYLRRRVMWQAVSDSIVNPYDDHNTGFIRSSLIDHVSKVPAVKRSLNAFFYDEDDSGAFDRQLQALYNYIQLMLGTGGFL